MISAMDSGHYWTVHFRKGVAYVRVYVREIFFIFYCPLLSTVQNKVCHSLQESASLSRRNCVILSQKVTHFVFQRDRFDFQTNIFLFNIWQMENNCVSLQHQLRWSFESALLIDKLRTMNVESEKTCNYE